MNITFFLPNISNDPIGGYKIVYEYANRLAKRGHIIAIVFLCNFGQRHKFVPLFLQRLIYGYRVKRYPTWFELDKAVKKAYCIKTVDTNYIPDADCVIATAVTTAHIVHDLPLNKGEKAYFIQGFENWDVDDEFVYDTYKLGMKNIVISNWLKEKVESAGAQAFLVHNGIDFSVFNIDILPDQRMPHSIAMLYHQDECKGCKYGIEVLKLLKNKYNDLQVTLFGVPDRPRELPMWIHYIKNANENDLKKIYNRAAIFICPSINDGFGLTGAESMACGCAFVSSSYDGVKDYAIHMKNSLLSPVRDVATMVDNIEMLFNDNELRINLAKRGNVDIQNFNWRNSVELFEKYILQNN